MGRYPLFRCSSFDFVIIPIQPRYIPYYYYYYCYYYYYYDYYCHYYDEYYEIKEETLGCSSPYWLLPGEKGNTAPL